MNKNQRNELNRCAEQLERLESELSSVIETIEDIKSEEEGKLDNLPDSLRESSRGEEIEECVERLDEILSLLEEHELADAIDLLNEF